MSSAWRLGTDKLEDNAGVRRFIDDLRKLRSERDAKGHLVLVEPVTNLPPAHEHAEELVIVDKRNTEEGIERLPARFGWPGVARVSRSIVEYNQLPALADQAQKAGLCT